MSPLYVPAIRRAPIGTVVNIVQFISQVKRRSIGGTNAFCSIVLKVLFNLILHVHGKQQMSCRDGHLLIYTVPGKAS